MIDYVEIRSADTRELIGIIDTATSIIWHDVYYGVGDFDIQVPCTSRNTATLREGNYVTRYNARNVGIIERVEITYSPQNGRMIVAAGRFAKSLLDRRVIYKLKSTHSVSPTTLRGNVEAAARTLVNDHAINCTFDKARNMSELKLGAYANTAARIVDDGGDASRKQVTYRGLLEYTDELLQEYGMGAYCALDANDRKLAYTVFNASDKSIGNTAGNSPVIFSQDFDNLLSSEYTYNSANLKNTVLIGGEGEGEKRFCSLIARAAATGSARREMWVDASAEARTYTDENEEEKTLTDAEYAQVLEAAARQEVTQYTSVETFNGEIDLSNSTFVYGADADFYIGDIVTVQDVEIGLYINPRLLEVTEVQDAQGYRISAKYGA